MSDLRYPIGKPSLEGMLAPEKRKELIDEIGRTPVKVRTAVKGLNTEQLNTPYRPGGWTVQQVVHHLADSHMNAFVRFKLGLTEEQPTIKPYDEKLWAETADVHAAPVEVSLKLLEALHERWVLLLRSVTPADFSRQLVHPERGAMTLENILRIYEWHGRHHTAHVEALRQRMGWS
jgi:hypothetical protein